MTGRVDRGPCLAPSHRAVVAVGLDEGVPRWADERLWMTETSAAYDIGTALRCLQLQRRYLRTTERQPEVVRN